MNNEQNIQENLETTTSTDLKTEEKTWFKTHGHVLSFWRWFFVMGVIGIVIGYGAGFSSGKHKGIRIAMKRQPHDMRTMMQTINGIMESKKGDELEKEFLGQMIAHHEGAVEMAQIIKSGSKRPELQKLSDGIVTTQNQEIGMMKVWLSEWFGIQQ